MKSVVKKLITIATPGRSLVARYYLLGGHRKVNGFPGRDHLLFDDDVVEPVDGDQPLSLLESLRRHWSALALAKQVGQSGTRHVAIFNLTTVLINDKYGL